MDQFQGRVAVITGGGGGIGSAMARAFAARGARLVLADLTDATMCGIADELRAGGADVLTVPTDVTSLDSVRALADTAIAVSPVDDIPYAAPSPLMPELMGSVEQLTKQMFGPIPVIPTMSTGATDGRWLRGGGIPTYGVSGLFGDPTDIRAHGRDERMMVKSFFDGQEFLYRLVRQLSSGKQPIS